ncbi:hypothetical protein ACVIM8_001633 [Bradyrhizobium sp. USDA 4529]
MKATSFAYLKFFSNHESQVRSYCRRVSALLKSAQGARIWNSEAIEYVDLLAGCGALNYGHNHPHLRRAVVQYLLSDGIAAGLDFHTDAKLQFMSKFEDKILAPRGLRYRMQIPRTNRHELCRGGHQACSQGHGQADDRRVLECISRRVLGGPGRDCQHIVAKAGTDC